MKTQLNTADLVIPDKAIIDVNIIVLKRQLKEYTFKMN